MLTNNLKKRLCKDFKLPIAIYDEPYFEYFVNLYDSHFSIKEKIQWLEEAIEYSGGIEEFFENGKHIADSMKEAVRATNAYQLLNTVDLNKEFPLVAQVKTQNIYIQPNVDRDLISVDLISANFNSLGLLGMKEEISANSYVDLLGRYTDLNYYFNSKMFRQIIFGDLNPGRQQRLQKHIIDVMCVKLQKEGCVLSSASSDEIIIQNSISVDDVENILSDLPDSFRFFRVEKFCFNNVSEEQGFFIKKTQTNSGEKLEFKNTPSHLFSQVFKEYYNLPLNDNDMLFYYEGFLAQFKEPLFRKELKKKTKLKI